MGWRDLDSCGRHLEVGYEATALGLPVEHAEFDWQRLRQQWGGVMDYFDDICLKVRVSAYGCVGYEVTALGRRKMQWL